MPRGPSREQRLAGVVDGVLKAAKLAADEIEGALVDQDPARRLTMPIGKQLSLYGSTGTSRVQ